MIGLDMWELTLFKKLYIFFNCYDVSFYSIILKLAVLMQPYG